MFCIHLKSIHQFLNSYGILILLSKDLSRLSHIVEVSCSTKNTPSGYGDSDGVTFALVDYSYLIDTLISMCLIEFKKWLAE